MQCPGIVQLGSGHCTGIITITVWALSRHSGIIRAWTLYGHCTARICASYGHSRVGHCTGTVQLGIALYGQCAIRFWAFYGNCMVRVVCALYMQ